MTEVSEFMANANGMESGNGMENVNGTVNDLTQKKFQKNKPFSLIILPSRSYL